MSDDFEEELRRRFSGRPRASKASLESQSELAQSLLTATAAPIFQQAAKALRGCSFGEPEFSGRSKSRAITIRGRTDAVRLKIMAKIDCRYAGLLRARFTGDWKARQDAYDDYHFVRDADELFKPKSVMFNIQEDDLHGRFKTWIEDQFKESAKPLRKFLHGLEED